jgi:hypothetical protein
MIDLRKLASGKSPLVICKVFPGRTAGVKSVFVPCWSEMDIKKQVLEWTDGFDLSETAFRDVDGAILVLLDTGRISFEDFDITLDCEI